MLYNDRCLGYDSAENCGISAVAVLGQGTDHVISVVCWGKDASQGQYRIVREMGYVRVAFGALTVESQCSWAVVQSYTAVADMPVVVLKTLLKPVEIPQVQFLDLVEVCPLL